MYIYIYVCKQVNTYIYIYVTIYVYTYMDIYIYIYMHTYIDVYGHMHVSACRRSMARMRPTWVTKARDSGLRAGSANLRRVTWPEGALDTPSDVLPFGALYGRSLLLKLERQKGSVY